MIVPFYFFIGPLFKSLILLATSCTRNRKAVQPTEILALKKKVNTQIIQLGNEKKKLKRKVLKLKKVTKELDFLKLKNITKKMKTTSTQISEKTPSQEERGTQCNTFRNLVNSLKDEISYWQNFYDNGKEDIDILINEIKAENFEPLKENKPGNPYSVKIRECVMSCLSHNVPIQNISSIISSIIQIFTGHTIYPLPSISSIHNMMREAKIVCDMQIEEVIDENENITLLKDATTKQGHHYYGAKINTSNGEYTLGNISFGIIKTFEKFKGVP